VQSSKSFGAWMHSLSVDDYEALVFAGWRRSGHYLYRPDLRRSCCQAHVIRLPAADYAPSSTHKRVLKRLRRVCMPAPAAAPERAPGTTTAATPPTTGDGGVACAAFCAELLAQVRVALRQLGPAGGEQGCGVDGEVVELACRAVKVMLRPSSRPSGRREGGQHQKRRRRGGGGDTMEAPRRAVGVAFLDGGQEVVTFATNAAFVVAGLERNQEQGGGDARQMVLAYGIARELKAMDGIPRGAQISCAAPGWVNVAMERNAVPRVNVGPRGNDVQLALCPQDKDPALSGEPQNDFAAASASGRTESSSEAPVETSADAKGGSPSEAQQSGTNTDGDEGRMDEESSNEEESGGEDPPRKREMSPLAEEVNLDPVPEGCAFTFEFVPSQFEEDEYRIYRAYQMSVHKSKESECKERSYRRFLVDSPLRTVRTPDGPPQGYGSFHIRYSLGGRLFAVGVVDILPQCLSSVYLFFDPAYSQLSPGVLSAVKEIEWVQQMSQVTPRLKYYVMGYYIHTCPKMAYKAAFKPSEIMCEETKHWVPASCATAALSAAVESGKRTIRVAPSDLPPAPLAAQFSLSAPVLSHLASETVMEFGDKTLVPFLEIERVFGNEFGDMCTQLRQNLVRFIELVGSEVSLKFTHRLR
jgi:arginyl-tRNA--protein-N-Asp/Glu arginylyltransferase